MVGGTVTDGTRANHASAPVMWARYGAEPSAGYSLHDPFLVELNVGERALTFCRFLAWMVDEQEVRPSVAVRLFTGLRFFFVTHFQCILVFSDPALVMAKRAMALANPVARWANRPNGQAPLPFVEELAVQMREQFWLASTATLSMKMQYLAVEFMGAFGRRPGEVAWQGKNKADHRFCWEDVVLERKYLDEGYGNGISCMLSPAEYLALPHPKPELELIRFTKRTSKMCKGDVDGQLFFVDYGAPRMAQLFADLPVSIKDLTRSLDQSTFVREARKRASAIEPLEKFSTALSVGQNEADVVRCLKRVGLVPERTLQLPVKR